MIYGTGLIILFLLFFLLKINICVMILILSILLIINILLIIIDNNRMHKKGFIKVKANVIKVFEEHWRASGDPNREYYNYPKVEYLDSSNCKHQYVFVHPCHLTKWVYIYYNKNNPEEVKEGICNFEIEMLITTILAFIVLLIYYIVNIFIK